MKISFFLSSDQSFLLWSIPGAAGTACLVCVKDICPYICGVNNGDEETN